MKENGKYGKETWDTAKMSHTYVITVQEEVVRENSVEVISEKLMVENLLKVMKNFKL